jgi:short subunit dehydrogenase-like uncharacterized protein
MTPHLLLYGATGYSGGLIADELKRYAEAGACRVTLAGRDGSRLRAMAEEYDFDFRVFGLDRRKDVRRGLDDVRVVINAAGPFAWTAERLAKVALEAECHYVDIDGEADVYRKLVAMVCGAGFWAAASDTLLERALRELKDSGRVHDKLGAVRIAMSRIETFSRASAETVWRSLREEVIVVRERKVYDEEAGTRRELAVSHEPVGKIERTFDFRSAGDHGPDQRIASVVSLVDTLAARLTVARHGLTARSIESYVEMDRANRMIYQAGALLSPLTAFRGFRALVRQPISLLAAGPTADEREKERHVILLQIEDRLHTAILDWRLETPNIYQLTAQLVAAVAVRVTRKPLEGFLTPAEVLGGFDPKDDEGVWRGCRLAPRTV